jgi:7-keto-8-aminopelargonate synthetase-like enzyme
VIMNDECHGTRSDRKNSLRLRRSEIEWGDRITGIRKARGAYTIYQKVIELLRQRSRPYLFSTFSARMLLD